MRKGEVGNFKTHMNDSIQQEIETWISQQQKINNLQISFMFDTSEAFRQQILPTLLFNLIKLNGAMEVQHPNIL